MHYLIAGAGLFGCVIAERIATVLKRPVEIFEARDHIGGNCYSSVDPETGIECHRYGAHIFHTAIPEVWDYITQITAFNHYRHKVLARHGGKVYQMPVNLATINALYNAGWRPEEARAALAKEIAHERVGQPRNLEEKAISMIGRPLYEAFIKSYTAKQWHTDPANLPEFIINRLPVRYNYNDEYFDDCWQGLPLNGYEALFNSLLKNPLITVHLNQKYRLSPEGLPADTTLIYTGMPDELLGCKFGRLGWRSLRFEWESLDTQDFQGTAVMNYVDAQPEYTRIHEFKHFHPERKEAMKAPKTTICREYPEDYSPGRDAYYPVNDDANNQLYSLYKVEADKIPGLILGGRLGAYRYWNMDLAIANALEVFRTRILPR